MKRLFCLLFVCCVFLLCGCDGKENPDTKPGQMTEKETVTVSQEELSPFDFRSYDGKGGISDIEQVDLRGSLEKACVSYKFSYLSENYKVKAYISIPLECINTETPYECIVYNRGGNSRIGWLTDEDTAMICAHTGRIVVASQYRGADSSEGRDEFGGADVNDVTALIDLCEQEFDFADINNLCMVGVSRGGMMSYIAARQDSRVKGIVAVSAVSDLFSSFEDRADMRELLTNYIGATPEISPEEYENRSAFYWTEDINVPVLIIHSKGDKQVSFAQAKSLHTKLTETNPNCTMITYEDSVHGLHSQDAQKISDWIQTTFL